LVETGQETYDQPHPTAGTLSTQIELRHAGFNQGRHKTMDLEGLRTMLDYHYWARDRVLAAVDVLTPEELTRDLKNSFGSVRDTLVHIYFAEWAWHQRWQGETPERLSPEGYPDVASIRRAWQDHEPKVRAFVEGLGNEGTSRVFQYKLMSGSTGASPFWQMLQHVVNHASYHRGQITTMLRQLGAQPPKSMDMIHFYRERG
jgi:uncharacterized damage-inducible protein DinB